MPIIEIHDIMVGVPIVKSMTIDKPLPTSEDVLKERDKTMDKPPTMRHMGKFLLTTQNLQKKPRIFLTPKISTKEGSKESHQGEGTQKLQNEPIKANNGHKANL